MPARLVTNRALPPPARYLYMILAGLCRSGETSCRVTLRQLAAVSGIRTVRILRRYLRQLVDGGWVSTRRQPGPYPSVYILHAPNGRVASKELVRVPAGLILHRHLSPATKCLYTVIAVHGRGGSTGFMIDQAELAQMVGLGSSGTVRSLVDQLRRTGWIDVSRTRLRTHIYKPLDPHLALRQSVLRFIEARLTRQPHKGEALMKEMLTVLIADDRFEDNARPGFLVNPLTEERLEFDRWYVAANVAFEFNGPQHYGTTGVYSDPDELRRQRARDLMKAAIAQHEGIRLITVQPTNLTFDWLKKEASGHLPLRALRLEDPIVRYLDAFSRAYVRKVRWGGS